MSNSNDSVPVDPFGRKLSQDYRFEPQQPSDPKQVALPAWAAPLLGIFFGALAGILFTWQNGLQFGWLLSIIMATVGFAGGLIILVVDVCRALVSDSATRSGRHGTNGSPGVGGHSRVWDHGGSGADTQAVPVLFLDEKAHEESGNPLEAALAMLLAEAAEAGAVLVDLDPRGEPTTHCYAPGIKLIEDAVPQMQPKLIAVYRRAFYENQDLGAIGSETMLDVDEIDFHQIDAEPIPVTAQVPLIGVGEPPARSYWEPATDGVGIQFCRAESGRRR